MACGGCSKRADVLRGMIKKHGEQQTTVRGMGQRIAVVGQHMIRDARTLATRSTLTTKRPR